MKARKHCVWYSLLAAVTLMIGGTTATSALPASMPQQESQENAPCLTIRRETVRFPNGKSVVMLIAKPARPDVQVLSFAPLSQRVLAEINIKQGVQGDSTSDLCLCDYNGRVTALLASSIMVSGGPWSRDERFVLNGLQLLDTQTRKLYLLSDHSLRGFQWSRIGNCFTYHEVRDKKIVYRVGTVTEKGITIRSATRKEVIRLMGDSFDQVDSLMQEVRGPAYSTSGGAASTIVLISPDGRRALVQGIIVQRKYPWVQAITSDDTLLTSLVEKGRERAHLLKPPEKTIDYYQWLDAHRWLIGREYEVDYEEEPDQKLRLALWDTETGKVWKAACPRFYRNEVFTFQFESPVRSVQGAARAR